MCYNVLKKESKMSPFPMFTFFWYFAKKDQNAKNLAEKLKLENLNNFYDFMDFIYRFSKDSLFLKGSQSIIFKWKFEFSRQTLILEYKSADQPLFGAKIQIFEKFAILKKTEQIIFLELKWDIFGSFQTLWTMFLFGLFGRQVK